jgi:hypothetical protein
MTPQPSRPLTPSRPASVPPPAATVASALPTWKAKPRQPKPICPKLMIYAVEGFGKTTIGAYAPDPLILMSRGETGYDTLLSKGRVPAVAAEVVENWPDTLAWIDRLIADPQGIRSVVFDATGGFDQFCQDFVCNRDFGGDWHGKKEGFLAFGADKGYKATAQEWRKLLVRLETLRDKHGVMPILLGHAKTVPFRNPMGPDYDTYTADISKYSWADTLRWADATLFGKFYTIVDKEGKGAKGKGIGGTDRVIYTEQRDAFSAKNRYGMPPELFLTEEGGGPETMWARIWASIATSPPPAAP